MAKTPVLRHGPAVRAGAGICDPPERVRRRLPEERNLIPHRFSIGDHEGYITVGMYDDGSGEIFLTMVKEGSKISGRMDSIAVSLTVWRTFTVPGGQVRTRFDSSRAVGHGIHRSRKRNRLWTTFSDGRESNSWVPEHANHGEAAFLRPTGRNPQQNLSSAASDPRCAQNAAQS
jgi:hypothetical protein